MLKGDVVYQKTKDGDGSLAYPTESRLVLLERVAVGPEGETWRTDGGDNLLVSWETVLWHYGSSLETRKWCGR